MSDRRGPLDFYTPLEEATLPRSQAVRPLAAPSLAEQFGVAARGAAANDQPGANEARRLHAMDDALAPIVAELEQRGVRAGAYTARNARDMWVQTYNVDAIWQGIAQARASDRKAFEGVEPSPDAFRKRVTAPIDARIAQERGVEERSSWTPWLAGQLAGGISDPENLVPIGVAAGRARSTMQAALQGAVANAQTELAFQPVRSIEAAKHKIDRGIGDVAADIALAGVTGGLFGGGIHAAQRPGTALARQMRERIGWTRMTAEQRDAVLTAERHDGIVASSPFRPGRDTHAYSEAVAARLAEVKAGGPLATPPARAARPAWEATARDLSPDAVISNTFRMEGGAAVVRYSQADGGTTKYGIAAKFNPGVDVENLTEAQARAIAKRKYWFRELDLVDPRTAAVAFDAGYASGPKVARRILRESGGDADKALVLYRQHLNRIADTVSGKARYRKGWNARIDRLAKFVGDADGPQLRREIFGSGEEGDAEFLTAQRELDAESRAMPAYPRDAEPLPEIDDIPFDLDDPRGSPLVAGRDPFADIDEARWNSMEADDAPPVAPDDGTSIARREDAATPADEADANAEGAARDVDEPLETDAPDYVDRRVMEPTKAGVPQERFDAADRSIAAEEMRRSWREDIAAGRKPQPMYVIRPVTGDDAIVATPSWTLAERTRQDPPTPIDHEIVKVHAPDDIADLAPAPIEPLTVFDDPHGAEAIRQADSLEHDLRMFLADDEAAGMTVRLTDDGDVVNAADVLDDLDADEAAIAAARACL